MSRFLKVVLSGALLAALTIVLAGCVPAGTLPYSASGVLGDTDLGCTSAFDGVSDCVGVSVLLNAGETIRMDVNCSNPVGGFAFTFGVVPDSGPTSVLFGVGCIGPQTYIFTAPATDIYHFGVFNGDPICGCPTGTADVSISVTRVGTSQLGDDRLNETPGATFAVYCKGRIIEVYGINSAGLGFFAFRASQTNDIPDHNVLLASSGNITLWRLGGSGLYQVNRGPDAEGKTYVFRFDGCPANWFESEFLS